MQGICFETRNFTITHLVQTVSGITTFTSKRNLSEYPFSKMLYPTWVSGSICLAEL